MNVESGQVPHPPPPPRELQLIMLFFYVSNFKMILGVTHRKKSLNFEVKNNNFRFYARASEASERLINMYIFRSQKVTLFSLSFTSIAISTLGLHHQCICNRRNVQCTSESSNQQGENVERCTIGSINGQNLHIFYSLKNTHFS